MRDKLHSVTASLYKLSGIRSDLVRMDPEWEGWDYIKLTDALIHLTCRLLLEAGSRSAANLDKLMSSLSPSQRREAPFWALARGEGTNSARLFTPEKRKGKHGEV